VAAVYSYSGPQGFHAASAGYITGAEGSPGSYQHFGSSGFAPPYYEQDNADGTPNNQVRHAVGGLIAGYIFGTHPGLE